MDGLMIIYNQNTKLTEDAAMAHHRGFKSTPFPLDRRI